MTNINHVFWGEIAPSDHFLQIYESDEIFLDTLEAFVCSGFVKGDGVVIVATEAHLASLNTRLEKVFNVKKLMADKQFIPLDAEQVLEKIMVKDKINEKSFELFITDVLGMVQKGNDNKVRVFGELVAILWGQGNRTAVIALEKLWDKLCKSGVICLFCAYPKSGFRQDAVKSIQEICNCHNNIIENNLFSPELNIYGEKLLVSGV